MTQIQQDAAMDEPIYGHMLIVSVGGVVDGPSFDRLMEAAIESSAWFSVSDQRISDIAIDGSPGCLREYVVDEIDDRGLLELQLPAPTKDESRSVAATCRELGLPYERMLHALDLRLKDEVERWLPGMHEPTPVIDGASIEIPPFEARF